MEIVRQIYGHLALGCAGGKANGLELDQEQRKVALLFQVRDGKVIRHVVYLDRADASADLGLEA